MTNFKLIKQCIKEHELNIKEQELLTLIEEKCIELFKEKVSSLYESAQQYLGSLRAQIASNKVPSQDPKTINILAGLSLLSDPQNWAAANLTNVGAVRTLDLVGTQADTTSRVSNFGASSPSMVSKYQKQLASAAKGDVDAKNELIRDLDRMRLTFSKLKGKVEAAQKPQVKLPTKQPIAKPAGIIRKPL